VEQRSIGELEVSEVGLGCNNFGTRIDQERTDEVFAACLDAGINFFDTADVYGSGASEEMLGHRYEIRLARYGSWVDWRERRMGPAFC
jgi:aryl-alcohol dehydrogenase-like predicted oxidoreductase